MSEELNAVDVAITEAVAQRDAGDYAGARDKLVAAMEKAGAISSEIETALAKTK